MNHRDTRPYYEDTNGHFTSGQYASPGGDHPSPSLYHHASYDYQQNSAPYYPPTSQINNSSHTHPYYRSMTPGVRSHRHSNSTSSREYYSSSGVLNTPPSSQQPHPNQAYYAQHYHNGLETHSPSNQTQFIPTPSEIANYTQAILPNSPPLAPDHYDTGLKGYSHSAQMLSQPQHLRPSRISTGRPRTASGATSPISATSPSGERFPCEKCGKTFSRSHDRKRHHETQHLPTPVIHRCRYCEKEFSRADSLKRHLDNGCDEMPQ